MHDHLVSKAAVTQVVLWLKAAAFVGATCLLAVLDVDLRWEAAVATLSVAALAVASVWQVRVYMLRLSALVRVANGLDGPDAELHSIGRRQSPR